MNWSTSFIEQYDPPKPGVWTGRTSGPEGPPQYLHEYIVHQDLREAQVPQGVDCAIIGYCCDEGVRRNQGRVGAVEGPQSIRQSMAKMAWHQPFFNMADLGDLHCKAQQLEEVQEALAEVITPLIDTQVFPLVLGGGHDIAYGHAKGILQSKWCSGKKLGIVNLDAHFDLRQPDPLAHSGSPFHQLLSEYSGQVDYLVLGIQKAANPPELFQTAEAYNVRWTEIGYSLPQFSRESLALLHQWLDGVDLVYLTIDLDGFSSAFSPGVSAASPMGFDPFFALQLIEDLGASGKLISMDLAECNPSVDTANQTALLAARLSEHLFKHLKRE
jgi:formiminoglutamase